MIGIFDSGIGGLTVTKEVLRQLPEYQLLYLGDTARTPYGNRSQDLIYQFTEQAIDYLFKQGCQLIIIACNTASAEALRKIQQEWLPEHYPDRRVLGVIRPVVEEIVKESKTGRIGVIGTRGTVNSGAYERELKDLKPEVKVIQQACPLLVPLVEEGQMKRGETMKILRNYLRPLKNQKIDTLILGCTHYPILFKQIQQICGKNIKVLDSAKIVAEKLQDYLKRHPEIETKLTKGKAHRFLVTDLTEKFQENAEDWLGQKIKLEKIELK
jgi:glutamate racemase